MRIEVGNPEAVARRALFLAWQACDNTHGMGWLQDTPGTTEGMVWENVFAGPTGGDYGPMVGVTVVNPNRPGSFIADYVFGRMMKLRLQWDAIAVTVPDSTPRRDYQAWCGQYPTYDALIEAAVASLATPAIPSVAEGASTRKQPTAPGCPDGATLSPLEGLNTGELGIVLLCRSLLAGVERHYEII
jgi:hypothetical protein